MNSLGAGFVRHSQALSLLILKSSQFATAIALNFKPRLFVPPCLAPRPGPLPGSPGAGAMLKLGEEVLFLGMPGHVLKKPKDAEIVDSITSVKAGKSAIRCSVRLRDGSPKIYTGVTRDRLHTVDQVTADELRRAREAARKGRSRRNRCDLKRRRGPQASGPAVHAAAAAAAIAAAKVIQDAPLKVPCAVCCRPTKASGTECISVAEAPPPRWLEKLQSAPGMHLLAPGELMRPAHQLNHQNDPNATVHEQWFVAPPARLINVAAAPPLHGSDVFCSWRCFDSCHFRAWRTL